MATVDDFIKFLGTKPEKLDKIECIFTDLDGVKMKMVIPSCQHDVLSKCSKNIFEEDETNRFKQP